MRGSPYKIIDKVLDVPLVSDKYNGLSFQLGSYRTTRASIVAEHALIYRPSLDAIRDNPIVRINSACFTGDIFGDDRCDCTDQLQMAIDTIAEFGGIIIYHLHHEGMGFGLTAKLQVYKRMRLDGLSMPTAMDVELNEKEFRSFGSAAVILHDLGIKRVRLMTNNPAKRAALDKGGIAVTEVIPVISKRPGLESYHRAKRDELNHDINLTETS